MNIQAFYKKILPLSHKILLWICILTLLGWKILRCIYHFIRFFALLYIRKSFVLLLFLCGSWDETTGVLCSSEKGIYLLNKRYTPFTADDCFFYSKGAVVFLIPNFDVDYYVFYSWFYISLRLWSDCFVFLNSIVLSIFTFRN